MSIPGLGLEAAVEPVSSTSGARTVKLEPLWEWRFEVGFNSEIQVKLISGTAEKDGTELAAQYLYRFSGVKSKILTFHGCELQIEGTPSDEFVAEYRSAAESPANSYLNLHYKLTAIRHGCKAAGTEGPRVMVCGPSGSGKTTLVRTLAAYATRANAQPIVVNADPKEGILTLPGTLSASVLASILDIEAIDGWGTTPTSGPNQVPVKLPLAFYFGHAKASEESVKYRELVSRLASVVTTRFSQDPEAKSAGMIIDSPSVDEKSKPSIDFLVHIVGELSANIVIVLGSSRTNVELTRRLSQEKTSLGEPIHVIQLEKSEGVAQRDENFMQQMSEASIREYFFGSVGRTLSPATQQLDFDSLVIYRLGDFSIYGNGEEGISQTEPSPLMEHWTLAVMYASVKDSPETVRTANVMGYVYIAEVDSERRKIKVLAPVSGRLGDRPLLLGAWPEPFVNLLG